MMQKLLVQTKSTFNLNRIVMSKIFWCVFALTMFTIPLFRSIRRELPPDPVKIYKIENFKLLDMRSNSFEWNSLKGKFVIVNFFFTRCPTICKDLMSSMQEVQKRVRGLGEKVAIISITVDPDYDNPSVLKKYADEIKINPFIWNFLTGSVSDIDKVVKQNFKSSLERPDKNSSDDLFDIAHSGQLWLADREGWIRGVYTTDKQSVNKLMIELGLMINR